MDFYFNHVFVLDVFCAKFNIISCIGKNLSVYDVGNFPERTVKVRNSLYLSVVAHADVDRSAVRVQKCDNFFGERVGEFFF